MNLIYVEQYVMFMQLLISSIESNTLKKGLLFWGYKLITKKIIIKICKRNEDFILPPDENIIRLP